MAVRQIAKEHLGDRKKWYGQNGMDKMVYGQNGVGQNGIGQIGTDYGQNGTDKMVTTFYYRF